jgi:hypothetical protein
VTNPSKAKGTAWESAVVGYLRDHGHPHAERRVLTGHADKGDVTGIPGVVIECKAERTITLAAYMDEVEAEMANANAPIGVAVVKRRNRPPADAYVVMTFAQFVALLAEGDES